MERARASEKVFALGLGGLGGTLGVMEKRSKSPGKLVFLLILHIVSKSGGSGVLGKWVVSLSVGAINSSYSR